MLSQGRVKPSSASQTRYPATGGVHRSASSNDAIASASSAPSSMQVGGGTGGGANVAPRSSLDQIDRDALAGLHPTAAGNASHHPISHRGVRGVYATVASNNAASSGGTPSSSLPNSTPANGSGGGGAGNSYDTIHHHHHTTTVAGSSSSGNSSGITNAFPNRGAVLHQVGAHPHHPQRVVVGIPSSTSSSPSFSLPVTATGKVNSNSSSVVGGSGGIPSTTTASTTASSHGMVFAFPSSSPHAIQQALLQSANSSLPYPHHPHQHHAPGSPLAAAGTSNSSSGRTFELQAASEGGADLAASSPHHGPVMSNTARQQAQQQLMQAFLHHGMDATPTSETSAQQGGATQSSGAATSSSHRERTAGGNSPNRRTRRVERSDSSADSSNNSTPHHSPSDSSLLPIHHHPAHHQPSGSSSRSSLQSGGSPRAHFVPTSGRSVIPTAAPSSLKLLATDDSTTLVPLGGEANGNSVTGLFQSFDTPTPNGMSFDRSPVTPSSEYPSLPTPAVVALKREGSASSSLVIPSAPASQRPTPAQIGTPPPLVKQQQASPPPLVAAGTSAPQATPSRTPLSRRGSSGTTPVPPAQSSTHPQPSTVRSNKAGSTTSTTTASNTSKTAATPSKSGASPANNSEGSTGTANSAPQIDFTTVCQSMSLYDAFTFDSTLKMWVVRDDVLARCLEYVRIMGYQHAEYDALAKASPDHKLRKPTHWCQSATIPNPVFLNPNKGSSASSSSAPAAGAATATTATTTPTTTLPSKTTSTAVPAVVKDSEPPIIDGPTFRITAQPTTAKLYANHHTNTVSPTNNAGGARTGFAPPPLPASPPVPSTPTIANAESAAVDAAGSNGAGTPSLSASPSPPPLPPAAAAASSSSLSSNGSGGAPPTATTTEEKQRSVPPIFLDSDEALRWLAEQEYVIGTILLCCSYEPLSTTEKRARAQQKKLQQQHDKQHGRSPPHGGGDSHTVPIPPLVRMPYVPAHSHPIRYVASHVIHNHSEWGDFKNFASVWDAQVQIVLGVPQASHQKIFVVPETGLTFSSEFECGNLVRVQRHIQGVYHNPFSNASGGGTTNVYLLWLEGDTGSDKRIWFRYAVTGCKEKEPLCMRMMNVAPNSRLYRNGMRPVWRAGASQPQWTPVDDYSFHVTNEDRDGELSFYVIPKSSCETIHIAFCVPYSYGDLLCHITQWHALVKGSACNIRFEERVLCRTLDQRKLHLLIITSLSEKLGNHGKLDARGRPIGGMGGSSAGASTSHNVAPYSSFASGKKVILISGRVHPGEVTASHAVHGIISFLLSHDPRAAALREHFIFFVVPMLNPDGVARGYSRLDQNGLNLNRCYNDPDPATQPTVHSLRNVFDHLQTNFRDKFFMYLDFHSHASQHYGFAFGNHLPNSVQHWNLLFPKLIALHSNELFDFDTCRFSKGHMVSKDGTSRVLFGGSLIHSYTIELTHFTDMKTFRDVLNPSTPAAAGATGAAGLPSSAPSTTATTPTTSVNGKTPLPSVNASGNGKGDGGDGNNKDSAAKGSKTASNNSKDAAAAAAAAVLASKTLQSPVIASVLSQSAEVGRACVLALLDYCGVGEPSPELLKFGGMDRAVREVKREIRGGGPQRPSSYNNQSSFKQY